MWIHRSVLKQLEWRDTKERPECQLLCQVPRPGKTGGQLIITGHIKSYYLHPSITPTLPNKDLRNTQYARAWNLKFTQQVILLGYVCPAVKSA